MIRDVPSPPDLAALIDAWIAATMGDCWKARCTTWSAVIHWRGWDSRNGYRNGTTYHHRDIRVFKGLGSVKNGPWPPAGQPERIAR